MSVGELQSIMRLRGDQPQRRFDHIHCPGSARIHSSSCRCNAIVAASASASGSSVRGTSISITLSVKRTRGLRRIRTTSRGASSLRASMAGKSIVGAGKPKKGAITPLCSRRSAKSASAAWSRKLRRIFAPESRWRRENGPRSRQTNPLTPEAISIGIARSSTPDKRKPAYSKR